MPRVYVKTLGCKVNTFDSHAIEHQFRAQGYEVTAQAAGADITVVNTCSVTANADKEARYLARRLRRESPGTTLVFTGCYAQTDSMALTAMDEIDFVVPNEIKHRLVEVVDEGRRLQADGHQAEKLPSGTKAVSGNRQPHFKSSVTLFDHADSEQTRAFLKIQDGCDNFCTYCLIPYARGASRSVPSKLVLDEVRRLGAQACPEIVLTGIHIGDYGRDIPAYEASPYPIVDLLSEMFRLPSVRRLRISSLEPSELSQALVDLLATHRDVVCDHMHLPLQAGSNRILKLMRRSYDKDEYAAAVARFRAAFPYACIGADLIPGFPSESDAEFEETVRFVSELGLSYLHVFPYSPRPNTAAMRIPGHVDPAIVKERAARLRSLSEELAAQYARGFIGRSLPVLWEKETDSKGRRLGRTPNYLQVAATGETNPQPGLVSQVVLKGFVEQGRLLGKILPNN